MLWVPLRYMKELYKLNPFDLITRTEIKVAISKKQVQPPKLLSVFSKLGGTKFPEWLSHHVCGVFMEGMKRRG